jgi:hypothetical protein
MNYTPKNTWVLESSTGMLKKGLGHNGIVVAIAHQEISGDFAEQIFELESITQSIPQMKEAETKATKFTKKK